jgi:hypothetical protein
MSRGEPSAGLAGPAESEERSAADNSNLIGISDNCKHPIGVADSASTFELLANALLRNGHQPIPVRGKIPIIENWTTTPIDRTVIQHWCLTGLDNAGIGLRNQPALDVDVPDQELADLVLADIKELLGDKILLRYGQRPKFLVPVYAPAMLRKARSAIYWIPPKEGDPPEVIEQRHKTSYAIEFLGFGQQWIFTGMHPKTRKPYEWVIPPGGKSMLFLRPEELIELTPEQFQEICIRFERHCERRGLEQKHSRTRQEVIDAAQATREAEEPLNRDETTTPVDDFNRNGRDHFVEALLAEGWRFHDVGTFNFVDPQTREQNVVTAERFTRPGKSDGISASLYQQPGTGQWRFHLWSSSVPELDPGDYNISFTYCHLVHGDDWTATISALKNAGFVGSPQLAETDFTDLAKVGTANAQRKKRGFTLRPVSEVMEQAATPRWLIDGHLPEGALASFFGPSGAMKSFLAVDLACAVALGKPWHGHPVKQGPVVYIAGEGHAGLGQRLKAWAQHHDTDINSAPLFLSNSSIPIDDRAGIQTLTEALDAVTTEHGPPTLVVVDTRARCFAGDENSSADIAAFITNLDDRLPETTTKLVIHHTGHTVKDRGRGSSAWYAALDSEFSVEKGTDGYITLKCAKMKDAEEPPPMTFQAHKVVVGFSERGVVESLALRLTNVAPARVRLSQTMEAALVVLQELTVQQAESEVPKSLWCQRCISTGVCAKSSFYRLANSLLEAGLIGLIEDRVFLREQQPASLPVS